MQKVVNFTAQTGYGDRGKGPVTELELGTYALSQSFSHTSHPRSQARSSVPNLVRPLLRAIGDGGSRLGTVARVAETLR